MTSIEVIRALKANGWQVVRQKGSHLQLHHDAKPGLVTVPNPKRDLPIGTLRSIEKQSGVTLRRYS